MTILLTGSTGFVGSQVRQEFASANLRVRHAARRKLDRLDASEEAILVGDIGPETAWGDALAGVDVVIHLAAQTQASGSSGTEMRETLRRVNDEGTKRLAEAAAAAGVRRFVMMSSVKAVGERTETGEVWNEDIVPAPIDAHGKSKLAAESAVARVAERSGMQAVVLRPPLVYGPGVAGNFRSLLRLCDTPWPLPLGGIDNKRSMAFVRNLSSAVLRAAQGKATGCYFIDDGDSVSTSALARELRRLMNRKARLFPLPAPVAWLGRLAGRSDIVDRLTGSLVVSSSRFRRAFDWTPPFLLRDGLATTVEWYGRTRHH